MSDISSLESELSSDESVEDETGSDKSDIDEEEVLGGSSTGPGMLNKLKLIQKTRLKMG